MNTINMLSKADAVKGQGVLSAYLEQVELVQNDLNDLFDVSVNRASGCDVMHYHTINLRYFLTLPLARLRGKTVGYVHFLPQTLDKSIKLPEWIKPLFYRYVVQFYKSMDYLVTVNPSFVEPIAACGIPREKIRYIPNYVSADRFHPLPRCQRLAQRERFGLDPERFTVLSAGQIQKSKGFFDFIDMARRMPQAQFVWAGSFAFGVISEGYHEIRRIVEHPPENVLFTGLIERDDMNNLYNAADVLFMPSYGELFPMTVLEAMSCGLPVLLRDLDNYAGILFDFYEKGSDNDAFEAILRRLRDDEAFYCDAAERARRGRAFYSRERVARLWKNFYFEVLCTNELPEKTARAIKRLVSQ